MKADNITLHFSEHDKPQITLSLLSHRREATEAYRTLKDIVSKGKYLSVEIKPYRAKRSLNANAYLWTLLSKMAEVLKTTKDELYLQMLDRYGVFTFIVVKPVIVDRVKEEWRTVRELGEVTVNGKTGQQLQCFFGSSTYDSKEMAVLIDGVISECKELDIETLPPYEIERMKNEWGKEA